MNKNSKNLDAAKRACDCLKAISHEGRLMILASLRDGESSVGEIVEATGYAQPTVSQHLAKMREKEIITARREGIQIFYSITDKRIFKLLDMMKDIFCK